MPQRTLIELDPAGPRYYLHHLASFMPPAFSFTYSYTILCSYLLFLFFPLPIRYLVMFNPVERERLCAVTVLVNTVRVRVLTEDGQTLPVQLSAQWSSASQMSAEVFEVRH